MLSCCRYFFFRLQHLHHHRRRRGRVLWLLLLLLSTTTFASSSGELEQEWDLHAAYPQCAAWRPYDQGACSSCCAHAIAAALSARACLQDASNLRLSAAQIWDCAGTGGVADCSLGGSFYAMLDNLGSSGSSAAAVALLPESCATNVSTPFLLDPNVSTCYARFTHCAPEPTPYVMRSVLFMDFVLFDGTVPSKHTDAAAALLMSEIRWNGPVISVLTLYGDDIADFIGLRSAETVFTPRSTLWQPVKRHCIVVYGWGVDAATGTPYWRVQNSMGSLWGTAGTGRVVRGRGVLELQWRAVSLAPRVCGLSASSTCMPTPAYGNYSTLLLAPPSPSPTTTTTTPSPQVLLLLRSGNATTEDTWSTGAILGLALGISTLLILAFGGFFWLWGSSAPSAFFFTAPPTAALPVTGAVFYQPHHSYHHHCGFAGRTV
jgi:hypothetical protein